MQRHLDSGCSEFLHLQSSCSSSAASLSSSTLIPCSLSTCSTREIWAVKCRLCSLLFCTRHRHPPDHECKDINTAADAKAKKSEEIKQFIASKITNTTTSGTTTASSSSKKLNPLIELMKLKQHSLGDDKLVPTTLRHYFKYHLPPSESASPASLVGQLSNIKKKIFGDGVYPVYLNAEWSVGRCIDRLCDYAKLRNDNNKCAVDEVNRLYLK